MKLKMYEIQYEAYHILPLALALFITMAGVGFHGPASIQIYT
jgi:hypothetical protein